MIYLDNAATGGSKPAAVQNAVLAALKVCANPGRSGHRLSLACAEQVLLCRRLLSDLFGGYGYERVVFTRSCTEALNIAILGTLQKGDHVVTTCLEHNSVLRPLHALQKAGIVSYDVVPLKNGHIDPALFASFVRENTRMCIVTAASNVTGEAPDIRAIKKRLPEHVLLLTDGAQGCGHLPIHMREWGIDALALAGHKGMLAMQGAAALLFSERINPRPLLFGGTGSESFDPDMPAFYPDRLEAGTLSYPAICSLFEGALLVKAHRKEYAERLFELTAVLHAALLPLKGYKLYFVPNPCGIASFAHEKYSSEELAGVLSEQFDIAVRGGLHCAPLVHKALGTFPEGLVRVSFSPMQSMKEVDALVRALGQITCS